MDGSLLKLLEIYDLREERRDRAIARQSGSLLGDEPGWHNPPGKRMNGASETRSMDDMDRDFWNEAYHGDPDQVVVDDHFLDTEVAGLQPGSALDLGCGSGENLPSTACLCPIRVF